MAELSGIFRYDPRMGAAVRKMDVLMNEKAELT